MVKTAEMPFRLPWGSDGAHERSVCGEPHAERQAQRLSRHFGECAGSDWSQGPVIAGTDAFAALSGRADGRAAGRLWERDRMETSGGDAALPVAAKTLEIKDPEDHGPRR